MVHCLETLKRLNDEAVQASLKEKPPSEPAIVITRDSLGGFDVAHNGKLADGLCFEEMLGLIASICVPFSVTDGKPTPRLLMWLKTPEERAAWKARLDAMADDEVLS